MQIVWVMADNQVNEKSLNYIDGMGLRDRIHFAKDPSSAAIDRLGIRRENAETIEAGVPHPATYLLDRGGVVRYVDVREDYHLWLHPEMVIAALANVR